MKERLLSVVVCLISILFAFDLFSQVSLVKDINSTPAQFREFNTSEEFFCSCGDYLFFNVSNEKGNELWRSDGTQQGTTIIKDVYKGYPGGSGLGLCAGNQLLYFVGNDGIHGSELWITDGTENGTRMVKDISPGERSEINILGLIGTTIYFLTDPDENNKAEVWKSEGTENTTVFITELELPGIPLIYSKMASETHLFFNTHNPNTNQLELWATDGTSANTIAVLANKSVGHQTFQIFGDELWFGASDYANNTFSMWVSDGSIAGTAMVKDFGNQLAERFHKFNDKLIISFPGSLWMSAGTEATTAFLAPGFAEVSTTIEDNFFGLGYDAVSGSYRLLKSDGITVESVDLGGTYGDIQMNGHIPSINNKLILQYFDTNVGRELGQIDQTLENHSIIKDINVGTSHSSPRDWASFNGRLYFLADDGINGQEIWSTDGTSVGTLLLKNILQATNHSFFHEFQKNLIDTTKGKLHLIVRPNINEGKLALYTSDGTEDGTSLKFSFDFGFSQLLGRVGDKLFYFNDTKFYKTDGSTDDVTLVKDITADVTSIGITNLPNFSLHEKLIFSYRTNSGTLALGTEFWVTDGTESGTHVLKDINPGVAGGVSGNGILLGSHLIFDANDAINGSELWITDGTLNGTVLLKDINPGVAGSSPDNFATLGEKIVFTASNIENGREVWVTDGTEVGTLLLADLRIGSESSELNFSRQSVIRYYLQHIVTSMAGPYGKPMELLPARR